MPLPTFTRNFGGAISLAHWLKKNYTGISTTVRARIEPEFTVCVAEIAGKPVEYHWVPDLKSISICLNGNGKFSILIPYSFNLCHRRFALCKELCHVLTDDEPVRAKNPSEQLDLARTSSETVRNAGSRLFAGDLNSEDFCFLLAMELMLPAGKRASILKDLELGESAFDIAYSLQIPESLIKFYRDSNYNSFYNLQIKAGPIELE